MKTVFIDGQEGTTGLQISDRLKSRKDIELIEIPNETRKDAATKSRFLNGSDLVILCLPDAAARESVGMVSNPATKIIDASTAHRTADGWIYGLPELDEDQRPAIRNATRVSNPGCYATGFILAVRPLVAEGVIPSGYPLAASAVSGYSGGGKKLIHAYEDASRTEDEGMSFRAYALDLRHKHLPEMQKWTGLESPPLLSPSVGRFYKGMLVSVPLITSALRLHLPAEEIRDLLAEYYESEPFVRVIPFDSDSHLENGFLSPTECNETNRIDLFVFGHREQAIVVARLDNLGKGASGAAIQNMNLMLGYDEETGLSADYAKSRRRVDEDLYEDR